VKSFCFPLKRDLRAQVTQGGQRIYLAVWINWSRSTHSSTVWGTAVSAPMVTDGIPFHAQRKVPSVAPGPQRKAASLFPGLRVPRLLIYDGLFVDISAGSIGEKDHSPLSCPGPFEARLASIRFVVRGNLVFHPSREVRSFLSNLTWFLAGDGSHVHAEISRPFPGMTLSLRRFRMPGRG